MTSAVDDYLKTIYQLTRTRERAGTKEVAERFGIAPPSVTGMFQKLAAATPPLVDYRKHAGAALTEHGNRRALEIIRRHRLIETFLVRMLDFGWDEVHEEACRLEHVVSRAFEERIDDLLGHPAHDPHGDPIPDRELRMPEARWTCLAELREGQRAEITRVSDRNADMLRHLASQGIVPGNRIVVLAHSDFDQTSTLRVDGRKGRIVLGPPVTRMVHVTLPEDAPG